VTASFAFEVPCLSMTRNPLLPSLLAALAWFPACADDVRTEDPPIDTRDNVLVRGLWDCTESQDTGYSDGDAFSIGVVTVDGKPVEVDTANAYIVMQEAADADGVEIRIVSGFRTMDQQEYFYGCYVNCNCNNCNLAAPPGYSNHQSGHALDLNTSDSGVLSWLNAHGASFGFSRTVSSEPWHWEWWGGGPGGGPCGASPECVADPNAGGCDGTVLTRCDDTNHLATGDCAAFGAGCSTGGGAPHCVHPFCLIHLDGGENGAFCTDDTKVGACEWGAYTEGDCAAYGGTCSEAGGTTHCVHFLCWSSLDGGEDGSFCHEGQRAACALGALTLEDCAAGTACVEDGPTTAACRDPNVPPPDPPPAGEEPEEPSVGAQQESSAPRDFAPSVEEGSCKAIGLPALEVLLVLLGAKTRRRRTKKRR
jgi:D-alanyl-D-alanine carboxypeptidase